MARPTYGYLHVALMHGMGGALVAAEMHGRIMESGLYDASEKISVVIAGDPAQSVELASYIFRRYPKYIVRGVGVSLKGWEWSTLRCMKADSEHLDADFWYAHTKGASNCRPDVHPIVQKNIRAWRGTMSHFIIGQHENCKLLLESYDAVGPYLNTSDRPHFAGNFWWARSSLIRSLPIISPELLQNRGEAEFWLGMNLEAKLHDLQVAPSEDLYDLFSGGGPGGVYGVTGPFCGIKGNV